MQVSNDVFGLSASGTNGGQTGANPISMDAIQEIQVVVAPFDVRQSGFTGGGINAITKQGTNTTHGSAYTYFNNHNMYGKYSAVRDYEKSPLNQQVLKGLRFDWDYSIDYTPEQQKAYEEMVLQHYKVKPKYFEEKYGIPCEEKEPKEEPVPDRTEKKERRQTG